VSDVRSPRIVKVYAKSFWMSLHKSANLIGTFALYSYRNRGLMRGNVSLQSVPLGDDASRLN
jgi:hypothetical protein